MIEYEIDNNLTPEEFIVILNTSTLVERRPVNELERIKIMLKNANIIITARVNNKLIGAARSVTDFVYCCFLSDLVVDKNYQKNGIGKELIR